jgi:predicted transcriptional regulator
VNIPVINQASKSDMLCRERRALWAAEPLIDSRHGLSILQYMKQLLVEIDDQTALELERVAPARSRMRSEFIRRAIRRALWDEEERATRDAYLQQPDEEAVVHELETWELPVARRRAKR